MMDKTIVVTGAYGFIGRHVARLFAQNGHTVLGIGHGEWARQEWELWGLSGWHQADITLATLQQCTGHPSAIIHCAGSGSVPFSIQYPLADFERTVVTTAHVLEYVRLYAPSCSVVYPSSASVYGKVDTVPIREDNRVAPISQYGVHKLMAEQMVASYARQFGTFASIVRLFSVYGSELRKQLLWDACRKLTASDNSFGGTGEEVRDWLHVEDAARLLNTALEHASAECPIVNGGSGVGVKVRDFLNQVSRSLSVDCAEPSFSGGHRPGDPDRYIADIGRAQQWGWNASKKWNQGVAEYVSWWHRELLKSGS